MEKQLQVLQEQIMARSVPCDAELQELMHQIDIMVNNKKQEWEKKMEALEVRMSVRDQELANAQSKLDQKGQEVGLLKQKLDSLQKTKYEMTQNYNAQLQGLKAQFAKLTQSYEKLQLHQLKQNKAQGKGQGTESQETPFQLSSLNQKLEEFKAKSREWDKQETQYQNHLVSLDAQRKLLSEKCNLFQKQAQNCQIQIRCQKQNQKEEGLCSQCKTEHLSYCQDVFPEPTERNEFFLEKLKSTVSEIAVSRNRLQEENLKLQQEVKMYQRKSQNTEARLTEVKNELQSRGDLLNMVERECHQLRKEVAKIEDYKNKEDNQVKLQSAYAQCIKELETKKVEMLVLEQQHENQQKELNQIRDRLYQEEQSHRSEVERMRTEISDLTEELHQREITIATITEKAALLERQLQMKLEIKEKMLGKQQMIDLSKKEHKAYSDSAHMLGHEDESLHKELIKLPEGTETSFPVNSLTCCRRNRANHAAVQMQEKEARPMPNENEWTIQPATYETLAPHRVQIPAWQGQGDIVSTENRTNLSPPIPCRDREPTVDGRSPSPPEVHPVYHTSYFPERIQSDVLLSHLHVIEESQMPSLESSFPVTATEKFLQEEEKRVRDFEKVLNSHIEELQRQSENTLKKYAGLKQSRLR
ncbi:deuterosome assembly protein 1 [Eublepharis macularius]|uniref:Deuterosome assembly protein 1 n=1 Tax=Eublepharis macularius TaxID=481883 RepID=A0AA97J342_EUBMA|nr:deuterosome assembly protein 1 [Eublepharis macularius]XP_054830322.1 deuterosome assembly protein 1 [Eublepharis macularius]